MRDSPPPSSSPRFTLAGLLEVVAVLILPYLERDDLYRAYNFNEPWDGPNNRKLAAKMPDVFRCPLDDLLPAGMTSYFAVVGPGRTKPGKEHVALGDLSDGSANTIALMESASARMNWLDPCDLRMEDIVAGKNTAETPCPCSRHGRSSRGLWRSADGFSSSFSVAMYDASAHPLDLAALDAKTWKILLTIDGGEVLDNDPFGRRRLPADELYLWPGVCVLLVRSSCW